MHVKEEAEALGELRDVPAASDQLIDIGESVSKRIGHFLDRRGAGVAHMRAGDRDRIEPGRHIVGVKDRIRDQPHRRAHRKDPGAARHIFLQDVILDRAGEFRARHALLVGTGDVHRVDDRGRTVDGKGRRYLRKIDTVEQDLHLRKIGERHADLADLRTRDRVDRVVAALRRQIERHGEAGLALIEQELVTLVGILGAAEPGILPHRPHAAAEAVGENASRERILAGQTVVGTMIARGRDQRQLNARRRRRRRDRFVPRRLLNG